MGRAPCCDKANVKRGPWSPDEDAKLKSYIELHGTGGNWIALPLKIGLKRCGKSCRLRWMNYLRPNLKRGAFSEEEDDIICRLFVSIGSRWSVIASQLPGRTDNDVKNHWNARLKKKLLGKHAKGAEAKGDDNGGITGSPQQPAPIGHGRNELDGRFYIDAANHGSSSVMPSTVPCLVSPWLPEDSGGQALQCLNDLTTELDEILRFNSLMTVATGPSEENVMKPKPLGR
ncbi:hypothetical protein MUK42_29545 [Musa troglodytarum]|uniref:Uncharacterized protein n=1 Tax=Musa troglodytarum TaxID=320322 RepID=A0A9E7FMZ3_9LILI|nr:hypothetical protein MUK42_29545 [Musa troglodytarum]